MDLLSSTRFLLCLLFFCTCIGASPSSSSSYRSNSESIASFFPPKPVAPPAPAPTHLRAPFFAPSPAPISIDASSSSTPPLSAGFTATDNPLHQLGRIVGYVVISLVAVLQAVVITFLCIKRRQIYKHIPSL